MVLCITVSRDLYSSEVTVIVNSCDVKPISLALNELRTMKFSLHEIHDTSEEVGSANALCALKGKIKVGVVKIHV